jgi:glucokinase
MILAGDIGGTKAVFALYDSAGGKLVLRREQRFASQTSGTIEQMVTQFLSAGPEKAADVQAACFGAPGPVRDGKLKLTNLPWALDAAVLAKELGIAHLFLINDLEANGYGIAQLEPAQVYTLNEGDPDAEGNRALVSAGTGLGEAIVAWVGDRYVPMASEGGHTDFGPANALQVELLEYLRAKFGHVSWERVVSGQGLTNIYGFLRDAKKMDEPAWLRERMAKEDENAVISVCGMDGSSELCAAALDMFVSCYGAEAGNMALKALALGGLYIGGGIAPKIAKKLEDGKFMGAFVSKGRLEPLLHAVPVRIILESRAALMGAAAYAEARAAEMRSARQ